MKETSMKMDSRTGLDYIVDNKDYVGKLGSALDTQNITVKKQVFELLSALCAYSSEGYNRALETLEHYMNLKSERYRFKLVVVELDSTTTVEYQIALLAFINCLIISAPTLEKRIKIRNEFIGLNLLPVINNLRRVAANVSDIKIQLDVFDEQRESDEAQSLQDPDGINLNSHLDVFYAILRQVADTPQEIPFLSILQHLLRIDPKEAISDLIWDTAETLVHRATLLENRDDSVRLLRAPSVQKFTCPHCRGELSNVNRKQSLAPTTPIATISSPPSFVSLAPVPPAPPPPPAPIPPPPIILSTVDGKTQNSSNIGIPPPPPMGPPNAPPAPPNSQTIRPKTPEPTSVEPAELLPQQDIPIPQSKMKTINWNKIPSNKVLGKTNIWSMVATTHKHKPITDLDWAEIEGLFCQQITQNTQGSPKLGRDRNDTLERKKKENSEINLLDGKRSLNVNIFLKQFRSSNEDIIQLIKDGEHDEIGAEKLRGLLKILPEVDEFDMLKSFDGDKSRLGNAEKFLLDLLKLSNYKLRIESMLLKEEFAVNMGYLEPAINAMLYAGEGLMMNKSLQEVLYMVLVTGNFLNFGGYAGNAAGVKLSSLQKLTDIRANKPGMNLIHFVALQAEKVNKDLLKFPDELTALENASKISVEQLNNELTTLDTRIKKIKKHIELPTTDADIKDQMMEFLQMAEREVSLLQRNMKELDLLRNKLAEFFCEDANSFKIEECFKVFQNFREKFRLAVIENERRKVQEEQATLRRKQREDQLALKKRHLNLPLESPGMENNDVLDPFQGGSPALSRRRFGSFHNNGDITPQRDTGPSPEGSLRRRKSRNLNEEDTLMDFLRSSGHDNFSRERKTSYGSLDRSWARRARTDSGSSSRKRPDLFHVDFGANRERAHSPSPLAEVKDLPSDETKPRISKEWHQKIQSWLQHNDHDDRKSGDYKVKSSRLLNRRSYEEESENERNKLDPLPEEKISPPIEPSKRTQSKWKPSNALERTDIVGTIEAIQDAQPNPRESSSWLSSENQRLRRQLSREKSASPQLESILEENKRKLVIKQLGERDASDQIHMYIRRPSDTHTMDTNKSPISIKVPQLPTELSTSRSGHKISVSADNTRNIYVSTNDTVPNHRNSMRRDKIEIDSDNIETPPSPRKTLSGHDSFSRNLQAPRPLHKETIEGESGASFLDKIPLENDAEVLGNGQFDRFSSARKTRRYKRPTNINSGSDEANMSPTEPLIEKDKNSPTNIHVEASVPVYLENKQFGAEDKEARLKRWQERLKSLDRQDDIDSPSDLITSPHATNRKNHSIINPNEVKEAANNLKNVTSTKIINNELNDEGFEESQSLVSDTPSQGKETLSGNENNDTQCDIKKDKPMRMTSTESATTSGSSDTKARADVKVTQSSNVIPKRSLSVRSAISNLTKREVPNRHNSLRKNDSQSSISSQTKRNVERSSSRTSLRSSRSSLNSAVSSSTVKRVPSKPSMYHKSSSFDTKKPPSSTSLQHSALRLSQRIPASRSSSSNSSVGSTTIGRYPPPPSSASSSSAATAAAAAATATTNNNINNNISSNSNKRSLSASHNRENQNAINSGTTAYPLKSSSQHNSSTNSINSYKINNVNLKDNKLPSTASTPPIRQNNFMRPTAASSTKAQTQPQTSVKGRFK